MTKTEKEEKLRSLMLAIDAVIKALFALKRELGGLKCTLCLL